MLFQICIKAQTLVCIARMVARDDALGASPKQQLRKFLDSEATKLEELLNECIANAKIAKEMVIKIKCKTFGLKNFRITLVFLLNYAIKNRNAEKILINRFEENAKSKLPNKKWFDYRK